MQRVLSRVACTLIVLSSSCHSRTSPRPDATAVPAVPQPAVDASVRTDTTRPRDLDAGAPRIAPTIAFDASASLDAAVDVPMIRTRVAPPLPDGGTTPTITQARLVPIPDGVVAVYFVSDGTTERFSIVARHLDVDGRPEPTSREIVSRRGVPKGLDADYRAGRLWIAFTERGPQRPTTATYSAFAIALAPDLRNGSRPIQLHTYSSRQSDGQRDSFDSFAAIAAMDDASAIVLFTSPHLGANFYHYPSLVWTDGVNPPRELSFGNAGDPSIEDVPNPSGYSIGILRTGALAHYWTTAVGEQLEDSPPPTMDFIGGWTEPSQAHGIVRRHEAWSAADFRIGPVAQGWDGTRLYEWFHDAAPPNADADAVSNRVQISAPAGGTEAHPVRDVTLQCAEGHAAVRIRWNGGEVSLDPTRPEATVRLADFARTEAIGFDAGPVAWAGRVLVGMTDGAFRRWRCDSHGTLVEIDEGGAVIPTRDE